MDSEVTQSEKFYSLLAWLEVNKKRVIWGTAIVAAASLVVFLIVWNRGQRENSASEALSEIKAPLSPDAIATPGMAEAYQKVADEYPNTQAGARARLLGATTLYTLNEYQRGLDQFQQFLRDSPESPWLPQASLGVAVCLDSLKRTQEATAKYDELIKRYANNPEAIRARMQLARLYEEQGKPDLALKLYEDIVKLDRFSSQGSMASLRVEDLHNKYPLLTAPNAPVAVNTNQVSVLATNLLQTNLPKPAVTNLAPANPPKTDKP